VDFTIPDELLDLKERTERFVRDEIMPLEGDKRQGAHGPSDEFRLELVALAKRAGLLSPNVGREWGGNSGDFIIDGDKWLITGAVGAKVAIIMARNEDDLLGPAGATMFLAPMDAPGIHIERVLDTMDHYMAGGHAVVRLGPVWRSRIPDVPFRP
jgi:alkylation response protein AidB-like acyl-CoA dehydrogenase